MANNVKNVRELDIYTEFFFFVKVLLFNNNK